MFTLKEWAERGAAVGLIAGASIGIGIMLRAALNPPPYPVLFGWIEVLMGVVPFTI